MHRYILQRLLLSIPTILGVATVSFLLMRLIPGDPARVIAGIDGTAADIARIRHQLGLDSPALQQYMNFVGNLLTGNLGISSRTGTPVATLIAQSAPNTFQLAALTLLVSVPLGCGLGILAAVKRGKASDIIASIASVLGVSMPVYWIALLLVIVFAVNLRILPAAGARSFWSFVLPVATLSLYSIGFIARQTRSAMLEVLRQDYVRTARAKGAGGTRVLLLHAFRNALLPIITIIGIQLGNLLGGAILTEVVFAWPGLGRLLVDSIDARDFPVVQGVVFVIAIMLVIINLITDLTYAVVDPRVRL